MKSIISFSLLLHLFLVALSLAVTARQAPDDGAGGYDYGFPEPGFDIPGFGSDLGGGYGYGYGYGDPSGGGYKSGVIETSVVCDVKGPCYNLKLKCPEKCFSSYAGAGKGYGYGGGGGGCNIDCNINCTASC